MRHPCNRNNHKLNNTVSFSRYHPLAAIWYIYTPLTSVWRCPINSAPKEWAGERIRKGHISNRSLPAWGAIIGNFLWWVLGAGIAWLTMGAKSERFGSTFLLRPNMTWGEGWKLLWKETLIILFSLITYHYLEQYARCWLEICTSPATPLA